MPRKQDTRKGDRHKHTKTERIELKREREATFLAQQHQIDTFIAEQRMRQQLFSIWRSQGSPLTSGASGSSSGSQATGTADVHELTVAERHRLEGRRKRKPGLECKVSQQ